jgi:hypothetical protein
MVLGDGPFHVLGQVVPQMPVVDDLDYSRRPLPSLISVGTRMARADHLRARVLAQPPGEGAGFPVSQLIDRTVGRHDDQHGTVAAAASQREFLDAEHAHASGLWV